MEDYKLAALNRFFSERNITHRFSCTIPSAHKLLTIKDIPIYARLADTPELVERGLMGVTTLAQNEGCLLCFGGDFPVSLWMKNCKINIQAAATDKCGNITEIIDMSYQNPHYIHRTTNLSSYVLEMPEGFFTKNSIKVGDKIKL